MDTQRLYAIRRIIRKDSRLSKLEKAFESLPEYSLDTGELLEEIHRIHLVRKTRHLNRKAKTFVDDITEGLIDDQAHRSRLAEILIECIRIIRNLENTLESMEGHLLISHSDILGEIRTKAERTTFIQSAVLVKYSQYVDKVYRVKESAELVITDIDKAGFMLKNLIESVKLATGRREIV